MVRKLVDLELFSHIVSFGGLWLWQSCMHRCVCNL